jgi:hypothetical protein
MALARPWLGALTLLVAACPASRPARDGAMDEDADAADGEAGSDAADAAPLDPLCFPGHDPESPALKVTALNAYLPLALSTSGGGMGEIFEQALVSAPLLLAFDALDDEEAASLAGGAGVLVGEVYAFDPDAEPPAGRRVKLDGLAFESESGDTSFEGQPTGLSSRVALHVRDAIFAGRFTTPERCSIGQPIDDDEWLPGGTLRGAVTVVDAKATRLVFVTAEYTVCQILSGVSAEYGDATSCDDVDEWLWPYLPDTMVRGEDGSMEPAWALDADFAASAVPMARDDR